MPLKFSVARDNREGAKKNYFIQYTNAMPCCRFGSDCEGGRDEAMARSEYNLRSKDVAQILDCSPDDVIVLAQRNKLRAKKEGRFWRFRLEDVIAYRKKIERVEKGTEGSPGVG